MILSLVLFIFFQMFYVSSKNIKFRNYYNIIRSSIIRHDNLNIGRFTTLQSSSSDDFDLGELEFRRLGLISEIVNGLKAKGINIFLIETFIFIVLSLGFTEPTPVQRTVIPRLMTGENLVMAASTGSGKTLAYLLPSIQSLLVQEQQGYMRMSQRPRFIHFLYAHAS